MDNWSDATLLLVGHGSTLNAESAAPTYQHAGALRRRGLFADVRECFWKQEPSIRAVMQDLRTPRVFVVPLFISEGYFTEEAIPQALGLRQTNEAAFARTQVRGAQTIHYGRPIGTHPRMTALVLARADDALRSTPANETAPAAGDVALFLAGHGTELNENSRKAIESQVERVRARGIYRSVDAIFLEETPRIGDCYQLTPARDFVIVPYFISDGLHSFEHIPVMLGESATEVQRRLATGQSPWQNPTEKNGRRIWCSRSVGTDPVVAEIILERVRESGPRPVA